MDKIDQLIINIPHSMLGTENILIKRISDSQQCHEALELAIKVFMEFEAPDYPTNGINEFKRSLEDPEYIGNLCTST